MNTPPHAHKDPPIFLLVWTWATNPIALKKRFLCLAFLRAFSTQNLDACAVMLLGAVNTPLESNAEYRIGETASASGQTPVVAVLHVIQQPFPSPGHC